MVLHGLLSSYLPSTSTPKSHGMLQTGGVRSVLSDTEVNPRLIYFVGVPRKTKNSRFGLLFRSLHVLLHVQKVNTVYSRAVIPVFKAGSGDNLATIGKCIWKTQRHGKSLPLPLANMERGCAHTTLPGEMFVVSFMTELLSF